ESKKGLCIRRDLLKVIFEFGDENEIKIEKKIPSSMTIAKLKTFVRKLFPSQLTNDIQFNLFVVIDKKHKELIKQYNDHVIDLSSQSINKFDSQLWIILEKYFPKLEILNVNLNLLTFILENFINKIKNVTNLSLSDNQRLIEWDPFINRLGLLPFLQELIINNCGIEQIKLPDQDFNVDSNELFQSLKYVYISDNKISSYSLLISLSILRNPIYGLNQFENEIAKQMIIARLLNLTYLNRVIINQDERRGAEINYLEGYAQDNFDKK
ncbi:unnamed protein product, partial [Rotaria sordida]